MVTNRKCCATALLLLGMLAPWPARARPRKVDVGAQSLPTALDNVARQTGVSLLFDRHLVEGKTSRPIKGDLEPEAIFRRLLRGSGLRVKQLARDSFVLVPSGMATPEIALGEVFDGAVPEILVEGQRSLNTDVRRHLNDVQPYRVLSSEDIAEAQSGGLDELFRHRLVANQQLTAASQTPVPSSGNAISQVNLRGLGLDQTLVLVDGRRMPSLPGTFSFGQADVNAIPPIAIERIEIYGGTAGGLYGPGATGGTVNIVLRQNLPQLWLQAQAGINEQGDGAQRRIDGGFTASAFGARTTLSLMASASRDDGLRFGDRTFVEKAALLRGTRQTGADVPVSNNVNIVSLDGSPLRLIPGLGGASLGSTMTNIPANAGGAGGDEVSLLLAGAGTLDYSLSRDGSGSDQSLLTQTSMRSLTATIRQEVTGRIKLFGNLIYLENDGLAVGPAISPSFGYEQGDPGNPFANDVAVTIPALGRSADYFTRFTTYRATAGLTAELPRGWKLEADAMFGKSGADQNAVRTSYRERPDVFSPGSGLSDFIASIPVSSVTIHTADTLRDYALRVAGSPFKTAAGPTTLTLSAERRVETVPNYSATFVSAHRLTVSSAMAQARIPLIGRTSDILPLRGLELQLAARLDRFGTTLPAYYGQSDIESIDLPPAGFTTLSSRTLALTAGAKTVPVDGLIVRASFATGFLPPSPDALIPNIELTSGQVVDDAKRPGQDPAHDASPVTVTTQGSHDLRPELARTLAIGAVLQPESIPGLRISVDYLNIAKHREIVSLYSAYAFHFERFEALYPERVVRAPLTSQDIAAGFTAGFITAIDGSSANAGHSILQTVDVDAEYAFRSPLGHFRLHASASWTPDYRRYTDPLSHVSTQYAGKVDGPLDWRANGGIEWQHGRLTVTADAQYYSHYKIAAAFFEADEVAFNEERLTQQGHVHVPAQAYIDLGVDYRQTLSNGRSLEYRVGVKNVFDKVPPLVVPGLDYLVGSSTYALGYSTYGDPRGRRAVVTVGLSF